MCFYMYIMIKKNHFRNMQIYDHQNNYQAKYVLLLQLQIFNMQVMCWQ